MLWICRDCTAAYAVGAPRCPQCGSTDHTDEGTQDMPKVTVHGGPSVDGFEVDSANGELTPIDEGGEESSPGSSSETSSEKPESSPEQNGTPPPSPARATGSRSKKGQTAASTAPPTDGDQTAGTSAADEKGA